MESPDHGRSAAVQLAQKLIRAHSQRGGNTSARMPIVRPIVPTHGISFHAHASGMPTTPK